MVKNKHELDKEILAAVATVKTFTEKRDISLSRSLMTKTMSFAKHLFLNPLKNNKKDLNRAIDILNKNALHIQSMALGEQDQQQLASSVYAAVNYFNSVKEKSKKRALPWRRWMDQLMIEIPHPHIEKIDKNNFQAIKEQRTKFSFVNYVENSDEIASKQEIDAFRMKAITLLKHHQVQFTSLTEQLHLIREVPIVAIEHTIQSKSIAESIIAMHQTISPLPGEMIELKGSFKRYLDTKVRSCPIPESFYINTQSKQTGYPHASQHNGWTVPHEFIKDSNELKKMKELAEKLMPQGIWNAKAKELLKLKQHIFDGNLSLFLSLHKKIANRLIEIAKTDPENTVNLFFEHLSTQSKVYHYLSGIHQSITTHSKQQFQEDVINKYVHLMQSTFHTIGMDRSSYFELLALKHFQEFIFEFEHLKMDHDYIYQWLNKTLESDLLI